MASPARTSADAVPGRAPKGGRDPIGGLYVALAALLFGGVVVIGELPSVERIPVPSLLGVRYAVAGVVLAVVVLARRESLRPARGEWIRLACLGALGYALESGLFFLALGRGTAATVTLLFYTYPIIVAVLTAVLGLGRVGALAAAALAAAVSGVVLVVASAGGLDISNAGILFAIGAATTFAVYLLTADRLIRRTAPLRSALWTSLSAAGALWTFALVTGNASLPSQRGLIGTAAMGVLTAGAFFFMFLGLRRVGAVRTSIVSSLEPVAAAGLAFAFLGEPLRAGVFAGGLLILAGAIAASVARATPDPERAVP